MSKAPHTSPKTVASPERSTDYVEEQALHLSVEEVRNVIITPALGVLTALPPLCMQLSTSLLELYQVLPPLLRQTEALTSELDKHTRVIAQHLAHTRESSSTAKEN